MPYPLFDRSRLRIQPLAARQHDLDLSILVPLDADPDFHDPAIPVLGQRLAEARSRGAARILMMGAHVLRAGVQRQLIDLMQRGLINAIAMNGAGPLTSHELAANLGLSERWVREWLRNQGGIGVLEYRGGDRFELSPEAALVFADESTPASVIGGFAGFPEQMATIGLLPQAFHTGIDTGECAIR